MRHRRSHYSMWWVTSSSSQSSERERGSPRVGQGSEAALHVKRRCRFTTVPQHGFRKQPSRIHRGEVPSPVIAHYLSSHISLTPTNRSSSPRRSSDSLRPCHGSRCARTSGTPRLPSPRHRAPRVPPWVATLRRSSSWCCSWRGRAATPSSSRAATGISLSRRRARPPVTSRSSPSSQRRRRLRLTKRTTN